MYIKILKILWLSEHYISEPSARAKHLSPSSVLGWSPAHCSPVYLIQLINPSWIYLVCIINIHLNLSHLLILPLLFNIRSWEEETCPAQESDSK